ncbi:hypothetical protein QYF36_020290 [Acer negundo]|nr:hypothetical protein QYF36_020290 [Acer negundo]
MEIFPETLKKLWNLWEIRSLLLLSISLQIILIVFGSRRKINNSHSWIGILLNVIVWCAYISADWVATVALSVMASNEADCGQVSSKATDSLQAFWAPFLLLHLGGPDTITAYSLEDNELWLRHFLGLIVQVGVAFYVFLRFWSSNVLTLLSIPVFITGIIKYGERTWVLWSSSSERFKDSLGSSSEPDPCFYFFDKQAHSYCRMLKEGIKGEDHNLVHAYYSYKRLLYLFANQIIDESWYYNYEIIAGKSAEDAFKLVAIELGLIYDVLYTKAAIVYSRIGISLRCISFVSSVSALFLFSIIIDKHSYPQIDITVTYLLLAGAVLLEIYAFMVVFSSDRTKLWLIKFKVAAHQQISKPLVVKFWTFSSFLHSCSTSKKRWSESMGQYNLKNSVRKEWQHAYPVLEKFSYTSKLLENYHYLTWKNVDISLQERIFQYLENMANELPQKDVDSFRQLRDERLFNKGISEIRYDHTYVDAARTYGVPPSKHGRRARKGITSNNCHFSLFKQANNCHSLLVEQAQGLCNQAQVEQAQGLFKQAQGEQARGLLKQAQGEQAEGLFEQARVLFKQTFDLLKQTRGEQAHGMLKQAKDLFKQAQDRFKQAQDEQAQGLFELAQGLDLHFRGLKSEEIEEDIHGKNSNRERNQRE